MAHLEKIDQRAEPPIDVLRQVAFAAGRRQGLSREDAEEAAHDVIVAYLVTRAELVAPEAWVRGAVRLRAARKRRDEMRRAALLELRAPLQPPGPSPDPLAALECRRILARLPKRDQILLWGAYARGEDPVSLSEQVGCKPASIKTLLARARTRARSILRHAEA